MALDPVGADGVGVTQIQQALPQIRVQGGFLVAFHPAPGPPALGPALFQGVDDILGVRPQLHLAGLLQKLQSGDHGGELHAVVGGVGLAAGNFPFVRAIHQDGSPAPGTRVPGAGAVGIDGNSFHIGSIPYSEFPADVQAEQPEPNQQAILEVPRLIPRFGYAEPASSEV